MAAVTIRNLPDDTHRALKQRATANGRSTEAEIRMILELAVQPRPALKIGTALEEFGRQLGGLDLIVERDQTPVTPVSFD